MNCSDKIERFKAYLMANATGIPAKVQDQIMLLCEQLEHGDPSNYHEVLTDLNSEADYLCAMLMMDFSAINGAEEADTLARYLDYFGDDLLFAAIKREFNTTAYGKDTIRTKYLPRLQQLDRPDARALILHLVMDDDLLDMADRVANIGKLAETETLDDETLWATLLKWGTDDLDKTDSPTHSFVAKLISRSAGWPMNTRINLLSRFIFGECPFNKLSPAQSACAKPLIGFGVIPLSTADGVIGQVAKSPSKIIANQFALTQLCYMGTAHLSAQDNASGLIKLQPILDNSFPHLLQQAQGNPSQTAEVYRSYLKIYQNLLANNKSINQELLAQTQAYLDAVIALKIPNLDTQFKNLIASLQTLIAAQS